MFRVSPGVLLYILPPRYLQASFCSADEIYLSYMDIYFHLVANNHNHYEIMILGNDVR